MKIKILALFRQIDWLLITAIFLLICLGLLSLYSLGLSQDKIFSLLNKQIISALIGFIFLFIFVLLDYRWFNFLAPWLYACSIILLFLVLLFGQNLRGMTGWFIFADLSFQPVELAKLAIILFMAKCLSNWTADKYQAKLWLKSFLIILPVCILILLQPDFGSMIIILTIWFCMLWLKGIKTKHFLIFLIILIIVSSFAWQFILHDYQKTRILTFINPHIDPLGSGYNTRQSIIAIGSGGLFGRGLSLGTQSQLHFLPVSEADFIFSSLAEEIGLLGTFFILILYVFFFYRLFKILKNSNDSFGSFLTFGFCLMFFTQVLINIGMAVGLLPVTGLPLPFISYGGSFLIVSLISIGIIQSIKIHQI